MNERFNIQRKRGEHTNVTTYVITFVTTHAQMLVACKWNVDVLIPKEHKANMTDKCVHIPMPRKEQACACSPVCIDPLFEGRTTAKKKKFGPMHDCRGR